MFRHAKNEYRFQFAVRMVKLPGFLESAFRVGLGGPPILLCQGNFPGSDEKRKSGSPDGPPAEALSIFFRTTGGWR